MRLTDEEREDLKSLANKGGVTQNDDCNHLELGKELGETSALGFRLMDLPPWRWPAR